jgi:hypothetical protein
MLVFGIALELGAWMLVVARERRDAAIGCCEYRNQFKTEHNESFIVRLS